MGAECSNCTDDMMELDAAKDRLVEERQQEDLAKLLSVFTRPVQWQYITTVTGH